MKGPDPRLVFAEYAAYELAALIGVPVPNHAVCQSPSDGQIYFASQKLRYRLPPEMLLDGGYADNPEMLLDTAVFDIWLANEDRNLGNLVAGPSSHSELARLYAIDFEASASLRGEVDLFTLTSIHPRRMLPNDPLLGVCLAQRHPEGTCDRVGVLQDALEPITEDWHRDLALPPITWCDRATGTLRHRAGRIHDLVREAWA